MSRREREMNVRRILQGTDMAAVKELAEQGNADALSRMGWYYYYGTYMPQNYNEAMRCFRKGAEAGDSACMYGVGWLYENGLGVTADHDLAIQWYRQAASHGSEDAKKNIQRLGVQ